MDATLSIGMQDLLAKGAALVRKISNSGETCYITEDGRAKAVLMDINRYNALMDLVEEHELPHNVVQPEVKKRMSVKGILRGRK